jgi:hypothetical protein
MIITIDTSRDSVEEIRKAVKMLMALLGEHSSSIGSSKSIFDSPSSGSGSDAAPSENVFGNIFGDNSGTGAENNGAGATELSSSTAASTEETPEVELY